MLIYLRVLLVFRKLFNSSSCEGDYTKIAVKSIDSPTMELILQYIYMRQMDINYNNVLDVMRAANYLCIKGLEQLCHEFLVEFLGPDNCVDLLQFAEYVIEIIDLGPSRWCVKMCTCLQFSNVYNISLLVTITSKRCEKNRINILFEISRPLRKKPINS